VHGGMVVDWIHALGLCGGLSVKVVLRPWSESVDGDGHGRHSFVGGAML
jgi:hypothetical protein